MSLPDWVGKVEAPRQPQALHIPLRTGAKARGWRFITLQYSSIPDPQYPYDPAVLAAINEFWPDLRYVGRTSVYASPLEEDGHPHRVTFFNHCLGTYVWNPTVEKPKFHVLHPPNMEGPPINQLDVVVQRDEFCYNNKSLPMKYHPLDWKASHWFRRIYDHHLSSEATIAKYITEKLDRQEREKQAVFDEFNAEKLEMDRYFERRLGELSDVEVDEYRKLLAEIRREQQKLFMQKVSQRSTSRPRVFV